MIVVVFFGCCIRKAFDVLEEQAYGPISLLNDGIAIRYQGGWMDAVLPEDTAWMCARNGQDAGDWNARCSRVKRLSTGYLGCPACDCESTDERRGIFVRLDVGCWTFDILTFGVRDCVERFAPCVA
jgi:hypothetical protein